MSRSLLALAFAVASPESVLPRPIPAPAGFYARRVLIIPQRLLRYIDDFLFISDNLDLARRFVQRMQEGFPDFGAFVGQGKTLLSFEYATGSQVAPVCLGRDGKACQSAPLRLNAEACQLIWSQTSRSAASRSILPPWI